MLDTVRLLYNVLLTEKDTLHRPQWRRVDIDNIGSWLDHYHVGKDRQTGIRFLYYGGNFRNHPRLHIFIPSLPRLIRRENVNYFAASDIRKFYRLLESALKRMNITEKVDYERLILTRADVAFNLLLKTPKEANDIFWALGRQPSLSKQNPIVRYNNGVYFRTVGKKRTPAAGTGLVIYNKSWDAENAGIFKGLGILRCELRLANKEKVKKWLGQNLTVEGFFEIQDVVMRTFEYNLKVANIFPGCLLSRP